jgi:hypothetical protein
MSQSSVFLGLIKAFIKDMVTVTVIFLAIYLFAVPLVGSVVASLINGEPRLAVGTAFPLNIYYQQTFMGACSIYMLVMGIVMPLYLGLNMSFGVTRREHTNALLIVGGALCLLLALLHVVMFAILGNLTAISVLASLAVILSTFLTGWIIVLGFQLRRVTTAILGFVIVIAFGLLVGFGVEQFAPNTFLFHFDVGVTLFSWVDIVGELILCACFAAIIVLATKRIPLKS